MLWISVLGILTLCTALSSEGSPVCHCSSADSFVTVVGNCSMLTRCKSVTNRLMSVALTLVEGVAGIFHGELQGLQAAVRLRM